MNLNFGGKKTTRMDVAKQVINEFVAGNGKTLKGRPNDLIGIITFARFADTVCPLTLGHKALISINDEIRINDEPNEDGTAYGDAAALAAARLKMLEYAGKEGKSDIGDVKSKIIILLTDGENNCGRHLPLEAAAMAKAWGIKIYTISLGEKQSGITRKVNGREISLPAALSATDLLLSKMADMTGGIFRRAFDYDTLQKVYDEIDKLEKSEVKTTLYKDYRSCYHIFIAAALALLFFELILNNTILRRLT